MAINEQQGFQANIHAIATQVEGEMVILQTQTGFYYGLRDMAAELWLKIAGGASRVDLVAFVNDRYQIDQKTCHDDIDMFLSDLFHRQLIELKRS